MRIKPRCAGSNYSASWLAGRFETILCPGQLCLFDESSDLRRRHCAGLARDFDSLSKENHSGDRGDPETSRETRNFFGVHLGDEELTGDFLRYFSKLRRRHFARSAPRRPKIDQHRHGRLTYERIKDKVASHIDRFT